MVKKKKFLKIAFAVVIALAALCALAIPCAGVSYSPGENTYHAAYGWQRIVFGVNGQFEVVAVPTMTVNGSAQEILYDSNGVILSCTMYDSQWMEFTIVNNNLVTVGLSFTLSTVGYKSISPLSGYEEGFYTADNVPETGVLTYRPTYVIAHKNISSQGWSQYAYANDKTLNGNRWSLYELAQKNQVDGVDQTTKSALFAEFTMVNNMPSRVYWRFRLRAAADTFNNDGLDANAVPRNWPYDPNVTVENVSFSSIGSFLNSTVGSFFAFPILPGITIGGIFAVLLSVVVVVIFLKMFAGG